MMRKTVLLIAIVAFVMGIAAPASFAASPNSAKPASKAADYYSKGDAVRKLGRGLSNCLTFPLEVPIQISNVNNSDGPFAAFTYGFVKGLVKCCFRGLVGMYEVSTFPIPFPEGYKPIINDPEFIFEDWNA